MQVVSGQSCIKPSRLISLPQNVIREYFQNEEIIGWSCALDYSLIFLYSKQEFMLLRREHEDLPFNCIFTNNISLDKSITCAAIFAFEVDGDQESACISWYLLDFHANC